MNLHDEIMKLKRESYPHNLNREDVLMAYRMGYRDARVDAAKLVKENKEIEQLRAIVHCVLGEGDPHKQLNQYSGRLQQMKGNNGNRS